MPDTAFRPARALAACALAARALAARALAARALAACVLAAAVGASGPAAAQSPPATVDGVVVYCTSSTAESYAAPLCAEVSAAAAGAFAAAGFRVVQNGLAYTEGAAPGGVQPDPAALRAGAGMTRPLTFAIRLKGTDDPAVFVGLRVAMPFRAATEAGTALPGLAGDLVVAERDFLATGPRAEMLPFLTSVAAAEAAAMVARLGAGR